MSEPSAAPAPAPTLAKRAIRGVAWTLPTTLGSRVVGLVGTVILARYVAPLDYGLVSAAAIVALTANNLSTFGVGVYLVGKRDLTREEAFHATVWFLGTGLLAIAVVLLLDGHLGGWFEAPGLERFLPMLLAGMALERVAYLPERFLTRHLRFRWMSVARALAELTYTGVSLGLAMAGLGAMAIAWGNLARAAVRFLAMVPAVDLREWLEPHRVRLRTMRRIVTYGLNVAFTSIAEFGFRRWDRVLVSRYFGPGVMGAYNYAYSLGEVPASAVGEQIGDVLFASLPHVEPSRRAGALARAAAMLSIIMLPLAFGLGVVAPTLVEAFLDEKWASVGTMLIWLSAVSATRPIAGVFASYLYARERPDVVLWLGWGSLGTLVLGLTTVGRLGVNWACATVAAVFVLQTLASMWTVRWLEGVPVSRFLAPLGRPLLACLLMVAAVVVARPAMAGWAPVARLLVEVAVGAGVYLLGALVIFRSLAVEFLGLVRSALSRR